MKIMSVVPSQNSPTSKTNFKKSNQPAFGMTITNIDASELSPYLEKLRSQNTYDPSIKELSKLSREIIKGIQKTFDVVSEIFKNTYKKGSTSKLGIKLIPEAKKEKVAFLVALDVTPDINVADNIVILNPFEITSFDWNPSGQSYIKTLKSVLEGTIE